jgi:hypothetical protein
MNFLQSKSFFNKKSIYQPGNRYELSAICLDDIRKKHFFTKHLTPNKGKNHDKQNQKET